MVVVASGLPASTAATQPWHLPAHLSLIQSPPSRLRLRKLSPCLPAGPATKVLTFNGQRHTATHSRPVVCNSTGSGSSQEQHQSSSQSSSSNGPKQPKQPKPWRWWSQLAQNLRNQQPLKLLLNVAFAFFLLRLWPMGSRNGFNDSDSLVVPVPFSEFVRRVKENDVRTVTMEGLTINYALRTTSPLLANPPQGVDATKLTFSTTRPADYAVPYDLLEKHNVMFSAVAKSGTNFSTLLVYALYAGLLLSAFGKMPLRLPSKGAGRRHKGGEESSITFDDVAGVDEAKEELAEIVDYLRAPERFSKLGARPPSGVLLVGPPGTGKTLLARAVAGEANVPFFSISASEFVELYVGMGAMRVRELFANARKESPSIVFIDEIDAVAKGRDMRLRSVGNDEREQTLNQLLTELDGFDRKKDSVVICIAATNRPDVLDQALLRPGRFDRRVSVERPDRVGRQQILGVHLRNKGLPLANDVSVEELAGMTTGFTGADLANLVNEAALLAGRTNRNDVSRAEFDTAILRSIAGIEKKRSILQGLEKDVVAKHEVGHALVSTAVARLIPGSSSVEKLSIIPRSGGALGFTYIPPRTEDRALMFDSEIRGQLAMLMGGRAAEQLTCSAVSTGASDDIRRATDLAYRAVSEFGLNPAIGPINVNVLSAGGSEESLFGKDGGEISRLVEAEVKAQLEGSLAVACHVLNVNRELHERLSRQLLTDEKMEGLGLQQALEEVKVPSTLHDFILKGLLPAPGSLQLQPEVVELPVIVDTIIAQRLREAAGQGQASSNGNGNGKH